MAKTTITQHRHVNNTGISTRQTCQQNRNMNKTDISTTQTCQQDKQHEPGMMNRTIVVPLRHNANTEICIDCSRVKAVPFGAVHRIEMMRIIPAPVSTVSRLSSMFESIFFSWLNVPRHRRHGVVPRHRPNLCAVVSHRPCIFSLCLCVSQCVKFLWITVVVFLLGHDFGETNCAFMHARAHDQWRKPAIVHVPRGEI